MSQYAALYSIVFMIGFVHLFDLRHQGHRFYRRFDTLALMTSAELDRIRQIRLACEEA